MKNKHDCKELGHIWLRGKMKCKYCGLTWADYKANLK